MTSTDDRLGRYMHELRCAEGCTPWLSSYAAFWPLLQRPLFRTVDPSAWHAARNAAFFRTTSLRFHSIPSTTSPTLQIKNKKTAKMSTTEQTYIMIKSAAPSGRETELTRTGRTESSEG